MPDTAKTDTQATQWCDEARKLLNVRTGKSKELKAARDLITKATGNLERQLTNLVALNAETYKRLDAEFRTLAGEALAAATAKNDRVIKAVAQSLETLGGRVLAAIVSETALNEALAKFDKAFAKLETKVAEAGALRGATTQGSGVKTALETAAEHMTNAENLRASAEDAHSQVNLDAATGQLAKVSEQLVAAKTAATRVDQDAKDYLKAMKDWGELKPQVQAEVQELNGLVGAEAFAREMETAFNAAIALIKNVDGVWSGHKEALEKVKDHAKKLTDGRKASSDFTARGLPPAVADAQVAANVQVARHRVVAPAYAANSYQDEVTALAQAGKGSAPDSAANAVTKLTELTRVVKEEADRLTTEKRDALAEQATFDTALVEMVRLDVPMQLYAPLKLSGNVAVQGDLAERQWASGTARLRAVNGSLAPLVTEYTTSGPDWKTKRQTLEDIRKQSAELMAYPALLAGAMALRDAANSTLMAFSSGKLVDGINAFNAARAGGKTLSVALTELLGEARAKSVTPGDDKKKAFLEVIGDAANKIYEASDKARMDMRALFDKLVKENKLTAEQLQALQPEWLAKTVAVEEAWQVFRRSAGGDLALVERTLKDSIRELNKLVNDLTGMKLKPLQDQAGQLASAAAIKNAGALPTKVQQMIDELKAQGADVLAEQGDLTAGTVPAATLIARLDKKRGALLLTQSNARKALLDKVTTEIDGPLKRLGISETYKKELKLASLDVQLMVNTGDPELLAVAEGMQLRLKKQIDDIAAQPKQHETNKKALEGLASRIGDLAGKLPETKRRLKTQLDEELVAAKNTDPLKMAERVAAFTALVVKAEAAVLVRDREVADYRVIKAKVRADFTAMKATTSTRLIDKAQSFEAYYEARIAEAKGLKNQEGGIPGAVKILRALQAKLDSINTDDNPEAKLRELDAGEKQDQRQMLDMAAQFKREVSVFLSTTLVAAKAATKDAEDGDEKLAESLEGVVDSASKIVGPYLKNLDLLPRGNNKAPDMDRMKADFTTARSMLNDAIRTAQRLIENPDSTNVSGPDMGEKAKEGLGKLARKWGERTQAFSAAVRTVATAVRTAAASEAPDVKANAEKAAKLIEDLTHMFRSEVFASAFKVLTTPAPDDKAAKATLAKQQLSARENALRVMRQCRSDLENPLLMKLANPRHNPFEAPTVIVATSGLATVLKEIELQALASA